MIQLTRSGTDMSEMGELNRLSIQFQSEYWVRLPQLVEPALLEMLCSQLGHAEFKPRVDEGIGAELCPQDLKTVGSLRFLANNSRFFEIVRTITGCSRIGCFDGRVYRMVQGEGCYDSWHNDMAGSRMAGMSINLSPKPYSGGVLLLRERRSQAVIAEIANTGFGDGVIFRIAYSLEHRITDVEGSVPKTAFAGWFQSEPDFFAELRAT